MTGAATGRLSVTVGDVGTVLSVNLGRLTPNPAKRIGITGIDKRPVDHPVTVADPGPKGAGGSGLAGDAVADLRHHGGSDQAVYAYALEDLAHWSGELGRSLNPGSFGENLTTSGLPVTDAPVGSLWRIGTAVLRVRVPRIPCGTFAHWLGERRWEKRFTAAARPGAYLAVASPGTLQAGDEITVEHLPAHGVTIGLAFRAMTLEPELLPSLAAAGDDLAPELQDLLSRRVG
jgi:MOSC domain-containing protein YiiM